jgi:hypothetical protein
VQDVFFPFERKLSDPVKRDLVAAVREANGDGYPVKAAVINTPSDLGLVRDMYGKPQEYAEYLGGQLGVVFEGHLLIAMPQGLGLSHNGGRPDPDRRLVADTAVGRDADATGTAAALAVTRLAATGSGDGGVPVLLVVAAVFTLLAAAAVAALVVVARRSRRSATAS